MTSENNPPRHVFDDGNGSFSVTATAEYWNHVCQQQSDSWGEAIEMAGQCNYEGLVDALCKVVRTCTAVSVE